MKILFIDFGLWDYDTTTPRTRPLGGTESAAIYLSMALAERGHQVTILNGVEAPRLCDGVQFVGLPCPASFINSFDIAVLLTFPNGGLLRSIGCRIPLVLWCHAATDATGIHALKSRDEEQLFAGLAMVSDWQRERYAADFGVPRDRMTVLRNAVSPPFLTGERRRRWLADPDAPILAYSSNPNRGLDILLMAFPSIRRHFPRAQLKLYSYAGMLVESGKHQAKDYFSALYELGEALPGVELVGSLPQPALQAALAAADVLAYPCNFLETSCIAAMEAMICGLAVVSSTKGALPETTGPFGHLLDYASVPAESGAMATAFAEHCVAVIDGLLADRAKAEARSAAQIAWCREQLRWQNRAIEWERWLTGLLN